MKRLIIAFMLCFSAVLLADEYKLNDSPKVGEKGRVCGTVGKVVDNRTIQLLVNGKTFIVKADVQFKDVFKDTVNGEQMTIAYTRTGTEELNGNKVAVVGFVREYNKEDIAKEEKDRADKVKIEAQKKQSDIIAKSKIDNKKNAEEQRQRMLKEVNAFK